MDSLRLTTRGTVAEDDTSRGAGRADPAAMWLSLKVNIRARVASIATVIAVATRFRTGSMAFRLLGSLYTSTLGGCPSAFIGRRNRIRGLMDPVRRVIGPGRGGHSSHEARVAALSERGHPPCAPRPPVPKTAEARRPAALGGTKEEGRTPARGREMA